MKYPFLQGYLDSLCGVYSVVNAHRILYNATEVQSQELFNKIITYMSKKRVLKEAIIEGMSHTAMQNVIADVIADDIPIKEGNKKSISTVKEFWDVATEHMIGGEKRVIILSIDGRYSHYTVVNAITDKSMMLFDSSKCKSIRKTECKMPGYTKDNKYVLFPAQCWFLGLD